MSIREYLPTGPNLIKMSFDALKLIKSAFVASAVALLLSGDMATHDTSPRVKLSQQSQNPGFFKILMLAGSSSAVCVCFIFSVSVMCITLARTVLAQ